jgi:hypothetical protein
MVRGTKVDYVIKFNNEFGDVIININKAFKKERKLTNYNIYMKNNFNRVKLVNPELKPKEVMGMVAKEWQRDKCAPKLCISLLNLFNEEELFAMLEHPEEKKMINRIVYGCHAM